MKVLYIFDEDDKYGGPKAGLEMIFSLREKYGINPVVITSKRNQVNEICDDKNIENYVTFHHKYTYVKSTNFVMNLIKIVPRYVRYILGNIISKKIIEKNIKMSEIDLIHTNISGIDIGALLGKKYNIPNVMHIREYGVGEDKFRVKSYRKNYISFLNKNVTNFIAISNTVGKFWANKGIINKKIINIYDGIYLKDIKCHKQNCNKNKINCVMLGSIHPGKGQQELIEALSYFSKSEREKIKVDIIGNGFLEEEKKIKDLIDKYKLNNVVFVKKYDPKIRMKLCNYDVGINCSFAEGFGRVTVEYMAAGLCVIASNRGANEEIITNNYNGIIYNKDNLNDLSNKLKYLMHNYEKREIMAENAIISVNKFDINKISDEIFKLYLKIKEMNK